MKDVTLYPRSSLDLSLQLLLVIFLLCVTYRRNVCSLKTLSSLCPPPLSKDHPVAVLWDLQTVPLYLNTLSKLTTPQAWKKLCAHDNVCEHQSSGQRHHYTLQVVLANTQCIRTNNEIAFDLKHCKVRKSDIMCGLLYRAGLLYHIKWFISLTWNGKIRAIHLYTLNKIKIVLPISLIA